MPRDALPCSDDPEMKNQVFDRLEKHIARKFNCSLPWRHDDLAWDKQDINEKLESCF